MEASLIKIGNSMCVIIPKHFLKETGMSNKVEIKIVEHGLFISPLNEMPRQGWQEKFAKSGTANKDIEFVDSNLNSWDEDGWTW